MKRGSGVVRWRYFLPTACLLVLSIFRFCAGLGSDSNFTAMDALIYTLPIVALVLAVVSTATVARQRSVQRLHPDSYVVLVVVYAEAVAQIRALQSESGLEPLVFRGRSSNMILTVERDALRIYRGFTGSKLVLEVPRDKISTIEIVRSPQGMYNLNCLSFVFGRSDHETRVNLLPASVRWGVPLFMWGRLLRATLADVQRAAAIPVTDDSVEAG